MGGREPGKVKEAWEAQPLGKSKSVPSLGSGPGWSSPSRLCEPRLGRKVMAW